MKLVIAEKPSVAKSIAKVLRARGRQDGYLEGSGYLVSWCVGHLVELADASTYDKRYAKWALADLPILPEQWTYSVLPDTKKQFLILKSLMARENVTSLVCATDAGREGELIFRLVYNQTGCRKPVERLWISSMEDSAIEQGFRHLQPGKDYEQLYQAALCRAQADWLVGINGTRLFSVKYNYKLNVGRVVTPTLALITQREKAIADFKSTPFYVVQLEFEGFAASSDRLNEKEQAEALQQACAAAGSASIKTLEKKKKVVEIPKGFVCENRACEFAIWKSSKFFAAKKKKPTKAFVVALLEHGKTRLTGCHSERAGKTYDATVVLDDNGEDFVNFKMEF